jgi:hypothetical protein
MDALAEMLGRMEDVVGRRCSRPKTLRVAAVDGHPEESYLGLLRAIDNG